MSQKLPPDREEGMAISHARAYTAPGVTVFYDRRRCLHFAECVRGGERAGVPRPETLRYSPNVVEGLFSEVEGCSSPCHPLRLGRTLA
jgi:hypothetical protein